MNRRIKILSILLFITLAVSGIISCSWTKSSQRYGSEGDYMTLHDIHSGALMTVRVSEIDRIVASVPSNRRNEDDVKDVNGSTFILKNGRIVETDEDINTARNEFEYKSSH